ncbi:MAG TPA: TetR/AcrR family transcriptional regulator [Candidatus Acidoferrales bacterium]|jgi:AcrR family transcriptional regulator|nr:TetR/AcrR family transcriptional regulator [Candidatus Acidoferrales bacterium]
MRLVSMPARAKRSRERATLAAAARTRQAERTCATRRKLLDAAKRIFAKDGFEAARLEDIAAGAGYTRGAFYANFKSKEDIFFALFEEWVRERIESLTSALRRHSDASEKLSALRTHYAELATDRHLVLISMEFKLFALRHPEAHARLRGRHRRIRASFAELFSEVMSALGKTIPIAYPAASACLGAVAQGLLLEHLLDPKTLSEDDVRHVLGLYFDSIFSRCAHTVSRSRGMAT